MKKIKSLATLCLLCLVALSSRALALSPRAFMATRDLPDTFHFTVPDVKTLVPEKGPLRDTLRALGREGLFDTRLATVVSTIQNVSVLFQADGKSSKNEEFMAAALMVPGATPEAFLETIADKGTEQSYTLKEPLEGLITHSSFEINREQVYTALYTEGDETFLLAASSAELLNSMVRRSKEPLNESFTLQGPLHITLSLNSMDLNDEMARLIDKVQLEMTLSMTEQKATLLSWIDPAVWKNYLTFESLPVDPRELVTVPLFGHRRIAALLSTQLSWIPKDITPQQLLSFLPPEEITEVFDELAMLGVSEEIIIGMLRNPLTFTMGDMVESPRGPMFSLLLHASNVPERLISQLPVYGTMLSMAFTGEKDEEKPVEFTLPDSSWKGYIVHHPAPFIFASSPERNLLSGTAPVEVLSTEAALHPSIKKFMKTPHIFALAIDVQAAIENGQALIFMPQEAKNVLSHLDVVTIFSDGHSTATAEIDFK